MTLAARGLQVRRGSRRVLTGIDFIAAAGDMIGVLGANGAGKSTLLKALAGLLPAEAGSVTIDGTAVSSWSRRDLARRIAYLPQERVVHWPVSVAAAVALGRFPHTSPRALGPADREAVDRALVAMDVAALADRSVAELSGGELARVLTARALAQEAAHLLADEPAAGLDLSHQLELFQRLASLAADGRCVVVALHDLSLAARFCHKLVLLKDGRRLAEGEPAAVLTGPLLAEAFHVRASLETAAGVPVVVPLSTLR